MSLECWLWSCLVYDEEQNKILGNGFPDLRYACLCSYFVNEVPCCGCTVKFLNFPRLWLNCGWTASSECRSLSHNALGHTMNSRQTKARTLGPHISPANDPGSLPPGLGRGEILQLYGFFPLYLHSVLLIFLFLRRLLSRRWRNTKPTLHRFLFFI